MARLNGETRKKPYRRRPGGILREAAEHDFHRRPGLLHFFVRNFGGENARARRQINLQKRLRLILDVSLTSVRDLPSEVTSVVTVARSAMAARTLESGNRFHSSAARENHRLPVVAKGSLQRIARERAVRYGFISRMSRRLRPPDSLAVSFDCALVLQPELRRLALRVFGTENGELACASLMDVREKPENWCVPGP